MWMTDVKLDIDKRGSGISPQQREIVDRLRRQAFAVQRQFELAEHSAVILQEMLREDAGNVASAIDKTYEGNTFSVLGLQLFRLLIVDLYACVLDAHARTGSVRSILKELRRDSAALDAIRAYYSDTAGLTVTVEGRDLTAELIEKVKCDALRRSREDSILSTNSLWQKVDSESTVLNTDEAKRICWARVKAIAHLEKTDVGIVGLDEMPPFGTGKLTYGEPIAFLARVRPFVYDVFALVTSTSWANAEPIDRFYVQAFWDRFKNGRTDLTPPSLT
jgi:hypothetical protein